MLDVALAFLVKNLNAQVALRTGSTFGGAELGRIVDEAGKCAIQVDHVGVAIVNVEEERVFRAQLPELTRENGKILKVEPPLRLNLYVMFAANFQRYDQALRHLSLVLSFFQANPVFTQSAYPGLDARIEKLTVELLSPSFEQLNQIWAFIGSKQLPSVLYKVRMVTLQDEAASGIVSPVSGLDFGMRAP
ncbi:DUF4255 domain-containing protein [Polyangium sp. y55x31]|uniref:DUF4255 domain-containing protein n=1 Tax=Polyangium sp. y55x31 TaxID=3042688 RepID=UPI002482F108|nr:DUF4255 domain-containing protein [Polyangium sp. y55x31]MDI1478929.1 DUF4255 domain-containing protein [Polyangium sp. y55x31]